MAIVLPHGRPAIDVVRGGYETPEEPWSHLGDPERRTRLEAAIAAVGRVDYVGHPNLTWGGTAFVVGPELLMTQSLGPVMRLNGERHVFNPGQSAVVDFGHERDPSESFRVDIEEVVYVDPYWKVELVKAKLPDAITPLKLSVLRPEELEDREVAIIGYPAWDSRNNDASLQQRLFGGVTEIKRLLPGRLHGFAEQGGRQALAHDCTTTGGCGGAPLVDIATGHVLGVHFAGMYLLSNYVAPAADLRADARFEGAGVGFVGEPVPPVRRTRGEVAPSPPDRDLLAPAIGNLTKPAEAAADDAAPLELEAIVIAAGRPALLARSWRSEMSDTWQPLLKPHERRLDLALRAVGRLMINPENDNWTATVFLVGDRLALTASFATTDFIDGAGARARLRPGTKAAIDFSDALGLPAKSELAAVTAVKFVHPFFHLALLELERVPAGAAPLDIAAQMPSDLAGRAIAVLSFAGGVPGADDASLYDKIYQQRWSRLFLQPGKALQVGQIPGSPAVPALVHDCSTAAGSAGAPVLDLGTGYVIGVHTHSKPLEGGFAQPTWELARDPHVWQFAIGLRPNPRPAWLTAWEELEPLPAAPAELQPPSPARWTVDDVPIDWSLNAPKKLERLLVASIDPQMALYSAENAGLPLGTVNSAAPGLLLWREIMKKASVAGVLRRLLEQLMVEPQNAGIKQKLSDYL